MNKTIEEVGKVSGIAFGDATKVINDTSAATDDLFLKTSNLYTLFGLESEALKEAKKTLIDYRDLLSAATEGSEALAKQIEKANKQIIDDAKKSGN